MGPLPSNNFFLSSGSEFLTKVAEVLFGRPVHDRPALSPLFGRDGTGKGVIHRYFIGGYTAR